MSDCTLKAAPTRHGIVVRLEGRGTFRESKCFDEFVTKSIEGGGDPVLIDLDRCSYLDSTFLGCLLILHRRFGMSEPRRFVVTADAEAQQRLLALTRLDVVLNCRDSAPESIGDEFDIVVDPAQPRQTGDHILKTHRELSTIDAPAAKKFGQVADQLEVELGKSKPENRPDTTT